MSKKPPHPNSLANLKPWKPGQSGNPGGRAKGLPTIAREVAPEDELAGWYGKVWRGEIEPTRYQLEAAGWLTERGHGKAVAITAVEQDDPLEQGIDRRIAEVADELAGRREKDAA